MQESDQPASGFQNTSGQGPAADFPPQADDLNWGAFFLGWIWGLGNNTPLALFTLIPMVGFGISIYLLLNGNKLAWKNKEWKSVAQFHRTQKMWAWCGIGCLCIPAFALTCLFATMMFATSTVLGDSPPTQMALSSASDNEEVVEAIGKPISKRWLVTGNIADSDNDGISQVNLRIPVSGPKGSGVISLIGAYEGGNWHVGNFELEVDGTQQHIELSLPPQ